MEQRFTLVGLPLHRDLQAPVTIGTQFSVRATPIEHDQRTIALTLITDKGEAALEITIQMPDKHGRGGRIRAISRSATSESSPLEKEVSTLAIEKELILGVIVKEHVFEIYLDTVFLLPFVHRVNPSEIKKLALDGAMICNEVVVVPVKTDMPPLPQYNEVSLTNKDRLAAASQPPPLPPPRQTSAAPVGGVAVLPPYPAGTVRPQNAAPAASSSIAKQPEPPGWATPVPPAPAPVPMPQPQPMQPMQAAAQQPQQPLPPYVPAHLPQQAAAQRAAAAQQPQQPPLPPPPPSAVSAPAPTTPAVGPTAPPVTPSQYAGAPLPPQAYPYTPSTGPQFQNIQRIPGLSYETGQPQPMQQPRQQQQPPYQPYVQYPGYNTPSHYSVQYQSYPTFPVSYTTPAYCPTAYYNPHCHYDWHHHHC